MISNIKTLFVGLLFLLFILCACSKKVYISLGQITAEERNEITFHGVNLAKKILNEDCLRDPSPLQNIDGTTTHRKQFRFYETQKMTYLPMAIFEISLDGINYKGSDFVNLLNWKEDEMLGFFTFKSGIFEGILDWSGEHHYNLNKECTYFNIHNSAFTIEHPFWNGLTYLRENGRDTSFLFGVKYFVETLWFVEEDQTFVLDLVEMKIYEPDELIKTKCYDGFVKDIAEGGFVTCNH